MHSCGQIFYLSIVIYTEFSKADRVGGRHAERYLRRFSDDQHLTVDSAIQYIVWYRQNKILFVDQYRELLRSFQKQIKYFYWHDFRQQVNTGLVVNACIEKNIF